MDSEDQPTHYSLSPKQRLRYVFYGMGYSALSVLALSDFSPSGILGWLGLPLLVVGTFHFLRIGLDTRPRFEFTSDGFVDRTFMGGGDLRLQWEDIQDVRWTTFGGQLEILVRDSADVRRRAGWPRKLWMYLGTLYGKKTISVLPSSAGPNLVELKARIEARLFEHERSRLGLAPPVRSVQEKGC